MVSVEEASRIIFDNLFAGKRKHTVLRNAVGKVLAEAISADRSFPPFDRVAMDGIAISFDAYRQGIRSFEVEGIQAAGQPQLTLKNWEKCLEVMTGAMLPRGTDTVIRYEDLTMGKGVASVNLDELTKWQNIHRQGTDAQHGETLLHPGIRLSAAEVALLASVGKSSVLTFGCPEVAVVSTGDELVDIDATPLPHQIRRSNVYAIEAALLEMGCSATVYHIPDEKERLALQLKTLLDQYDVIIVSGGVSKGKFDYVPQVLVENGVEKLFHQVTQRPGKPFWFGRSNAGKTVFALPGNPVSTFMCFYRYVKPWILKSMQSDDQQEFAVLGSAFTFQPKLTCFLQVNVTNIDGALIAAPVAGAGSGDFANLKDVSGFLELPLDRTSFSKGEVFRYIPFR